MRATVRVPASVANLGPGFDILALALQVQNEVVATTTDDGVVSLEIEPGDDDAELRDPARNLVARGYLEACARLDLPPAARGVRLRCVNAIPVARGLGSSAAATLSGVLAAVALHRAPWDERTILDCAASFEGHVDNLAAALLGGVVICAPGAAVQRVDAPDELHAVVFAPQQRLATQRGEAGRGAAVLARRRHLQRGALCAAGPRCRARRLGGAARGDGRSLAPGAASGSLPGDGSAHRRCVRGRCRRRLPRRRGAFGAGALRARPATGRGGDGGGRGATAGVAGTALHLRPRNFGARVEVRA